VSLYFHNITNFLEFHPNSTKTTSTKRHLVVSGFIFHFPQLEPIKATSVIGRHKLREGDEAVLVAVVLLQHLVDDLHRPPKPHPLSGFCVLGWVVEIVTLGKCFLLRVVVVVLVAERFHHFESIQVLVQIPIVSVKPSEHLFVDIHRIKFPLCVDVQVIQDVFRVEH